MKILAIETSCDETGIALVEGVKTDAGFVFVVHKATLLSQALLHAPYGGVYPNMAKREHEKNLPSLFAEFEDEEFDAIAVTAGPGLEPALWTGITFAQELAKTRGKPLLPVNHMEGHFISSLARLQGQTLNPGSQGPTFELKDVQLPVLGLLISGGHTEFVLMKEWFEYEIVGRTLDDAVGEAFDKVARMLGLSYPGGPEISKLAKQHRSQGEEKVPEESTAQESTEANKLQARGKAWPSGLERPESAAYSPKLPRPMINSGTCDFSFSGLKTAALYALRDLGELSDIQKAAFAAEFEDAVTEVLVAKARQALEQTGAQTFVIGGGVAANSHIRTGLEAMLKTEFPDVELRLPELSITGDNAIMIAEAALARRLSGLDDAAADIRATGNLAIGQKVL